MENFRRDEELKNSLKNAVIEMLDQGKNEEEIVEALDVSLTFVCNVKLRHDIDVGNIPEEHYQFAPKPRHCNEKVVIDGKTYTNVVDYIVDCGA